MKREGWVCQEAGWWTREGVGSVVREDDGTWTAYPDADSRKVTGFRTCAEAVDCCERAELWHPKDEKP